MDINIKEDDDRITVSVKGDIELYTHAKFKNRLFELTQTSDKNIDIDLSKVDYMDSSGLGTLVSLHKIQNKKGRKLTISNVNADIRNLIRLSTLSDIFEV
ncbi:MAG TPA: STAS domain-containing protein [Spirochaetota bacterium]|jgi:anti-sigma B factor antagonist|nr:STAS domain-containing protein [Spirochaetota bacterium]HPV40384.1 STAS domain-containing protein [Spirochaetota bacterium]